MSGQVVEMMEGLRSLGERDSHNSSEDQYVQKFWGNRLAATEPPLEISQTRIPEIPDQKEFLDRWFEFHQGFRLARRPDGTEQRIAVIGEPLHEVSPGFLPRTLDQLRAGIENDARRPENRLRRRRLTSENERPTEPHQSLEDALDSLLDADSDNETREDGAESLQPPISESPTTPQVQPDQLTAPPSLASTRRQRAQERFARVFGTVEDIQQEDYESPLSTLYNRAWNRYRQAEDLRAIGDTEAPPLEGLSAQERREIEDQLLWGVMRESRTGQELENNVWSYAPVRNNVDSETRSGDMTITPPWSNFPATHAPPDETVAAPSTSLSDVRLSLEQITSELQRLRSASESVFTARDALQARSEPEQPFPTLDNQPDRPPPKTEPEMTKVLACQTIEVPHVSQTSQAKVQDPHWLSGYEICIHIAIYISRPVFLGTPVPDNKMSQLGKVRIGHKAPDFHTEAVIGGAIREVSLSAFIRPSAPSSSPDPDAPWLLLLFIPAAFSFVCPTEVIAFQNCYDEFRDRNCKIAFVSVDTKHSLWHWQNVPRQYGGLGNTDIPLLSDATHKIGRDYGVLVEEEGVCLRGMFIIDNEGLVQQITLNNLTVGRSVLEALRLLEAFQAVAKHGVLCPIDWKPNSHASDALNTISDTLVESYEDRLANLQRDFGDVQVTDLDAKREAESFIPHAEFVETAGLRNKLNPPGLSKGTTNKDDLSEARDPPASPGHTTCKPRVSTTLSEGKLAEQATATTPKRSHPPSPITAVASPAVTPSTQHVPPLKLRTQERTARHSRGHHSSQHQHHAAQPVTPKRLPRQGAPYNMFSNEAGSQVYLEFEHPVGGSQSMEYVPQRPRPAQSASSPPRHPRPRSPVAAALRRRSAPVLSRATSWSGMLRRNGANGSNVGSSVGSSVGTTPATTPPLLSNYGGRMPNAAAQTRLQATFQAIKKISSGLASPRFDASPRPADGEGAGPGYFNVSTEEEEEEG
ncbi:hypothetical protein E8E13_002564 [Curvularia kusanoi]|uniref:Thioredoxin domain-containing protein n=1 Tax=Curvularia kusanoi TaxID=90978 RepID=A0A9P4T636_CURKU|nr:hypothetical protein E8E13_002564 [Curvularia kusanoi]